MTALEARIAKIAFVLGRQMAADHLAEADRICNLFVLAFENDLPCHYEADCLRDGRCPFDPVCNH